MALIEATQKAIELQPLVGTVLSHSGLMVKAVIPAPVDARLFTRFVLAVKDEVPNESTTRLYADVADIIDASNFEVAVIYEGRYPKTKFDLLYGIKWEWYSYAR